MEGNAPLCYAFVLRGHKFKARLIRSILGHCTPHELANRNASPLLPPSPSLCQELEEGERSKRALRREVEQVGVGCWPAAQGAAAHAMCRLPSTSPSPAQRAPQLALLQTNGAYLPHHTQVLADLRRQQREAADSAELAATREARLRGELAEVGGKGLGS